MDSVEKKATWSSKLDTSIGYFYISKIFMEIWIVVFI